MPRSTNLIDALKRQLKQSGITYRKLAQRLYLSESAVKQMFASGNFSLKRLDEICDVVDLDISELVELAVREQNRLVELGLEREKELVADLRLLLIAYCLVNHWSVDEILKRYSIEQHEAIGLLTKLDRMGMIELLPGNRVRLLIANNFKWLKHGPIEQFFRTQVQGEFFKGNFNIDGALRLIKNGDISKHGLRQMTERLQAVGNLFDEICREERKLPAEVREGTTMILAIRNWEFTAFVGLEKEGINQRRGS